MRIFTVVLIGQKINSLIDLDWAIVLILVWVSAGICCAIAVGLGLISVGACLGVCFGRAAGYIAVGTAWSFYALASNAALSIYFFSQLSEYLSGSDSSLISSLISLVVNFVLFGVITRLVRRPLK